MRASCYAAAALVAAMTSASPIAGAAQLTIGSGISDIRDRARVGSDVRESQTSTIRNTDVVRTRVSRVQPIPEGDLALLGCDVFVVDGPEVVFLQVADGTGLLRLPDFAGESCAEVLDELLADNLEIDETKTVSRSVAGGTFEILVWVLIRP